MIQEILMWGCVIAAFGYAGVSLVKTILQTFQKRQQGCSSVGCCGCSAKKSLLKDLKLHSSLK